MLFCHGTPGSRLFRPAEPTLLSEIDVDLVTVDRLGYGQSTAQPGRTLLDWPRDVAALADELGWQHFAVAGISGGGPHALACGRTMPERVTAVGVISGVAPFWPGAVQGMLVTTRQAFWLARWGPWLLVLAAGRLKSNRDHYLVKLRHELPVCDRQIVDRDDVQAVLADNYAESVAAREMGHEMIQLRHACGFVRSEVQVPVWLRHGERDRNVPVAHAHRMAAALPDCHMPSLPAPVTTSSSTNGARSFPSLLRTTEELRVSWSG